MKKVLKTAASLRSKDRFPALRLGDLTYLDSAATTQVPRGVLQAVHQAMELRGNPGRSSHGPARRSAEILDKARATVASFLNVDNAEIVLTAGSTDGINLAIDAIAHTVGEGDEVVASVAEHHSTLLPLLRLTNRGAKLRLVGLAEGALDLDDLSRSLNDKTRVVALHHASNVLGSLNDIRTIGRIVRSRAPKATILIDGAQAVAHVPVDLSDAPCDFYAFSGHKMYGPDGTGALFVSARVRPILRPSRVGGGSVNDVAVAAVGEFCSLSPDYRTDAAPLQAGTPNVSGAAGLARAIGTIREVGFPEIERHERALTERLIEGLSTIPGVTIYGPGTAAQRVGLVSFSVRGARPKDIAAFLDKRKICVRAGSHCAFPLAGVLGGESVRVSLGVYSDEADIEKFLAALRQFVERSGGHAKNPNLDAVRGASFSRTRAVLRSKEEILGSIKAALIGKADAEVVVMGGHFLAIPSVGDNSFYPSIEPILPPALTASLEEFGMSSFPLFTLDLAAEIVAALKAEGARVKILVLANDTTGINELRLSPVNAVAGKTAGEYRNEMLSRFSGSAGLPECYLSVLHGHGLDTGDVLDFGATKFLCETKVREHFKRFVSENGEFFDGLIDYRADDESMDISIKALENQEIKTCVFDSFHSKTGGKFCVVEVTQILAELFGAAPALGFHYLSERVRSPKVRSADKVFVALSPAMCNNAVNAGAELYAKLFRRGKATGSFQFLNVPFGPNAADHLALGIESVTTAA